MEGRNMRFVVIGKMLTLKATRSRENFSAKHFSGMAF
jgi:hypothetical protein